MNPIFSIIIPTYNSESTIERAIESIFHQKNINSSDFEVIVVDDKSEDDTNRIIKSLRSKYKFKFKRLLINSGGPSKPRNIGINMAKGEFIMFLDSDDWLAENTLSIIKNNNELMKSDLIIGKSIKVTDTSKTIHAKFISIKENINKNPLEINKLFYYLGPHAKFISTKLIREYNIEFSTDLSFGEDKLFFFECYRYASKVSTLTDVFGYIDRTSENHSVIRQTNFIEKRKADIVFLNKVLSLPNSDFKKVFAKRIFEYDLLRYCNSNIFLKLDSKSKEWLYDSIMYFYNDDYIKKDILDKINPNYLQALNNGTDNFVDYFTWLRSNDKTKEIINGVPYLVSNDSKFYNEANELVLDSIELTQEFITVVVDSSFSIIKDFNHLLFESRTNYNLDKKVEIKRITEDTYSFKIKDDYLSALEKGIYNIFFVYDDYKNTNIKINTNNDVTVALGSSNFYRTINGNLALKKK